jgi:hypothetical protein
MSVDFPAELFRHWIGLSPGAFSVNDLSNDIATRQVYIDMCEGFVDQGVLDRHGGRRGWYVPRQTDLVEMDYHNVEAYPLDIWLPFELSDLVELYENSVVVIAGAPNSGKTALLLNIIRENMLKDWDVSYFNSEMSASELQIRLKKFSHMGLHQWTFKAYERSSRFADVIKPGPNQLNIIDFLEVHDEFYKIGQWIKEIHDRLSGGIAVVAIQKNPNTDTGLGGFRTMEVTRLALALDFGKIKITKAKNFKQPDVNPNGLERKFNLVDGCQIITKRGWYKATAMGEDA